MWVLSWFSLERKLKLGELVSIKTILYSTKCSFKKQYILHNTKSNSTAHALLKKANLEHEDNTNETVVIN